MRFHNCHYHLHCLNVIFIDFFSRMNMKSWAGWKLCYNYVSCETVTRTCNSPRTVRDLFLRLLLLTLFIDKLPPGVATEILFIIIWWWKDDKHSSMFALCKLYYIKKSLRYNFLFFVGVFAWKEKKTVYIAQL